MKTTSLVEIIRLILSLISPHIFQIMKDMTRELKTHASKTDNKWDDVLAEILGMIIK